MKYRITDDDDGHWYIFPDEKMEEVYKFFEDLYKYYEKCEYETDAPEMPKYLKEIDSPQGLTFENPEY